MNRLSFTSLSFLMGLTLLLEGCGSVRKTFGLEHQAPDEFAVTPSEAPLDMPPDFFVLPTPTPGAPRPQDITTSEKAFKDLTGKTAQRRSGMSSGESALLDLAGAESGQDKVRREVDNESRIEDMDETLLEKLRVKEKKRGKALNPYDESETLQKQGVPTSPYGSKSSVQ